MNIESVDLLNLRDSIAKEGVINPINVRSETLESDDKEYTLIDGLQRFTASSLAGLSDIPAQILERTEAQALVTQIVGNAQRIETKIADYAKALLRVLGSDPTMTVASLAGMVNKSPAWVDKILSLTKTTPEIQKLLNEGKINVVNGYMLSKLPIQEQNDWLERAQTMNTAEFTPQVTERTVQIRTAAREGRVAGAAEFVPVLHLRNKGELETEMRTPAKVAALLSSNQSLINLTNTNDVVEAVIRMTLQWALNGDPDSIAEQKRADEARKEKAKTLAEARKAEKEKKKQDDAAKEAATLREKARLDPSLLLTV